MEYYTARNNEVQDQVDWISGVKDQSSPYLARWGKAPSGDSVDIYVRTKSSQVDRSACVNDIYPISIS